ncbi:beta-galactosidase [Goodfellowiella coeruleoviolacea]|uniref:beta-galactosidase n=1 Tax=Goodfellowiella coeruleoviolacea TaxID=334858 RepID=UPI000B057F42|nr:beta-galactosidase [Goodfellowiella coeruleoviolacea]
MPWLLAVLLALVATSTAAPVAATAAPTATGTTATGTTGAARHQIGYDRYSLTVDGQRVLLWAGEFHYFRLPSPDLWRDALEKIKAAGFNGVSLYFHWGYHSPKPGVYDFTGVRDIDRLLRMAEEVGLYVVARPGPYINAETSGGGFPAWLKQVPDRARSSDPGYTAAYREWLNQVDPILARHQLTRGGSIIAYNVENEYGANTDPVYMEQLQQLVRAHGIDVPIVHNNCCGGNQANWSSGQGAVQIPGVDDYPQSFDCPNPDTWGSWGEGVTRRLRADAPVYAAEYQAGAIDLNNAGYDRCRDLTGPDYMKVFYKSNIIASGATMYGYYMTYGGTSWGWLPQPNDVYTSYDYGAAITEQRQLTPKYDEFKRQGYFVTSVAPLAKTDPVTAPVPAAAGVHTEARANPDTRTQFLLVRHPDRGDSSDVATTVDWSTPDGRYTVPVRVAGRDAKILVAGYDLGGQRLVWSNSEILTHAPIGGRDVAVLYGRDGEQGSTVLRYAARPSVTVLAGQVRSGFDAATGDLRLDYTHSGLARVLISGGGRPPLLLLLGTDQTAARFWRLDTPSGPVLVRGTALARSARVSGDTVLLRAETDQAGEVEVFAPAPARRLVVGGDAVRVRRTASGTLLGTLSGPRPVRLPALTDWRHQAETPEADPGFDDSGWTAADHTTTVSPIKPKTLPVLYSDDYGFHHGSVWYRGRFTATGAETAVSLNAITGKRGVYLVWLNGHYLGSAAGGVQADSEAPINPDPGRGDFAIPPGLLAEGSTATLAVLVENMGHNDDWTAEDTRFKQPRGLFGATVAGSTAPIAWKIQGARGGEDLADPARGPLNTGGRYGERAGWHLPGFPDAGWPAVDAPEHTALTPGISWYRTSFRLDLPRGQDVSVGLRFAPPTGDSRVLIFLNGWNLGQYGAGIGPQREFVLPAGLLREHGDNTLALAVLAPGANSAGPGPVSLVAFGNHTGGVPVRDVPAPGYHRDLAQGA